MTRVERAAAAARLREKGLNGLEIAAAMGISNRYVSALLNDPSGAKVRARKDSYRGRCLDCGAPTNGSNGRAKAPTRCKRCAAIGITRWTPSAVIAAMRRFHDRYGRPPTSTDLNPAKARRAGHPEKADRFYADGDYPASATVGKLFGSWNAAIEACGWVPMGSGQRRQAVA